MALHISMIMKIDIHKVHDIPKQETQKLNNSNISPPFCLASKGKRHQFEKHMYIDLKVHENI